MTVTALLLAALSSHPPAAISPTYASLVASAFTPDHWYRMATDDGVVLVDSVGGKNGAWTGAPGLLRPALTQISPEGRSVGFKGTGTYAVINNLTTAASFTIDLALQIDRRPATKMMVLTTGGGTTPGEISLELIADEDVGARIRFWSVPSVGSVVIWRTVNDTVPIGQAFKLSVVRDASTGGVGLYVNGTLLEKTVESGTPPSSWPAVPERAWRLGQWPSSGATAPFEGLMSELLVRHAVVDGPDIGALNLPLDASWLSDLSAGTVEQSASKTISLAPFSHPVTGAIPSIVEQATQGTASVSGNDLAYAAGATPGEYEFRARATSNGVPSRSARVGIEVLAAPPPPPPNGEDPPLSMTQLGSGSTLYFQSETMGWEDRYASFSTNYGAIESRASIKSSGGISYLQIDVREGEAQNAITNRQTRWTNNPARAMVAAYDIYLSPNYDGYATAPSTASQKSIMVLRGGLDAEMLSLVGDIYNDDPSDLTHPGINRLYSATSNITSPLRATFEGYYTNRYEHGAGWQPENQRLFGKSYVAPSSLADEARIIPGVWTRIEIGLKLNTNFQKNGEATLWVNGVRIVRRTNIMWAWDTTGRGIKQMNLRHAYGGTVANLIPTKTMFERYRNLKIWGVPALPPSNVFVDEFNDGELSFMDSNWSQP